VIHNVHERRVAARIDEVGALLGSLGSADDRLWPVDRWIALELDRPIGVGVHGGHGSIRYTLTEYVPGRRLVFVFDPPTPLVGTHRFEVAEHPDGGSVLRHVLDAQPRGSMRLLAPLAVGWVHDAVLEDALDRAERFLGVGPARPARWSPYVRLLRRLALRGSPVHAVRVPDSAFVLAGLPGADLADSYAVALPPGASVDARDWHERLISAGAPSWVSALAQVRTLLARALRLRTAEALVRNGPFTEISAGHDVVVAGADDKHLDFRVLVEVTTTASGRAYLVLTTVVQRHNRLGRAYFALIRPFHARIVPAILRRAVQQAERRPPAVTVPPATAFNPACPTPGRNHGGSGRSPRPPGPTGPFRRC
jgi:hypothetical protein